MNINVYLEDSVASQLDQYVKYTGKSRNALLREAVKEWLNSHHVKAWPQSILRFKGFVDSPAFENYRDELTNPEEDPLA